MTAEDLVKCGYEDVVVFDGEDYDGCIIGVTTDNRAVYSKNKMIRWYMDKNQCSYEDAVEWIDYNTIGSLGFEGCPVVLELGEEDVRGLNESS